MKLHELRDNRWRNKSPQTYWPWSRLRHWVRPVAVVSRVKSHVQVWRSKALKAARCRSTNVLPKRGFNKPNRKKFAVINLGLIQKFVDAEEA